MDSILVHDYSSSTPDEKNEILENPAKAFHIDGLTRIISPKSRIPFTHTTDGISFDLISAFQSSIDIVMLVTYSLTLTDDKESDSEVSVVLTVNGNPIPQFLKKRTLFSINGKRVPSDIVVSPTAVKLNAGDVMEIINNSDHDITMGFSTISLFGASFPQSKMVSIPRDS